MSYPATVAEFKARFIRDFVYGDGLETVRDEDINTAMVQGNALFNGDLWSSTDESKNAFLLVAAHCLVLNVQMAGGLNPRPSGQGINNKGGGIQQSKSVGQVSVNYAIPQDVANSPALNQFMRTDYGQQYLQLVAPRIVGNVAFINGPNDTGIEQNAI